MSTIFAYVANPQQRTVEVLDTAINEFARVEVGNRGPVVSPFGIAITPNGKRAYVVCDDGVVVLETSTIVTTVPVDGLPLAETIPTASPLPRMGNVPTSEAG